MILIRKMKINRCEEIIYETRNYNKIDFNKINENIINEENYIRMLENENPDEIAEYLIDILNKEMDLQEPIRKIKIN